MTRLAKTTLKLSLALFAIGFIIPAVLPQNTPDAIKQLFPTKTAQAASLSSFAGTTNGTTADTSYATLDCTDNSSWAGTGSPGNASASDGSYISITGTAFDGGETTDELQFSGFNFSSIPDNATIDGVVVEMERYRGRAVLEPETLTL